MSDNELDAVLNSLVGSAVDYAGIERLFKISLHRVGRLSDAADVSATQGDRSSSTLLVKKESQKVVAQQASPPSIAGVSLLSPTGGQALEPPYSRGLAWSARYKEQFARFKAWQELMQ